MNSTSSSAKKKDLEKIFDSWKPIILVIIFKYANYLLNEMLTIYIQNYNRVT